MLPGAGRIDLSMETGTRFYAASGCEESTLIIQFHHSCSDGLEVTRFFRDLLAAYADPSKTVQPVSLEQCGTMIKGRNRKPFWFSPRMPGRMWRAFLMARRTPVSLIPHKSCAPETPLHSDFPSAIWQTLGPEDTSFLTQAASRQRVTLNDLLLRDLLLTLADWRGHGGIAGQNGWVRILVPVIMKKTAGSTSQRTDPISMLFLDLHTEEIASPNLLGKIHWAMKAKILGGDGELFLKVVALGRRLRGGLSKHLRANKCLFTTIFSNLGKVPLCAPHAHQPGPAGAPLTGGLALEGMQAVHVIRRHSPVNFVVMTVDGSLSLTMTFDSRVVQRTEAETLFQRLLERIRDSAKHGI